MGSIIVKFIKPSGKKTVRENLACGERFRKIINVKNEKLL